MNVIYSFVFCCFNPFIACPHVAAYIKGKTEYVQIHKKNDEYFAFSAVWYSSQKYFT